MSAWDKPSDESDSMGLEAAKWLILRDRGFTPAEQDEFMQWLAADERHRAWLVRQQRTWQDLSLLVQWRPEHSAEPNPDLLATRTGHRRRILLWAGMAAAACLVAALCWPIARQVAQMAKGHPVQTLTALQYEKQVLADGTVVALKGGTTLRIAYEPAVRRIQLINGEANFQVAHNPARPFLVEAAGVTVKAVGTVFGVKLAGRAVEVLVTEGKVSVNSQGEASQTPGAHSVFVAAGHRVVVGLDANAAPPQVLAVSHEQVSALLGWRPVLLNFDSTPLQEVVAAFNRHNRLQLKIEDPSLKNLPIVASVRSDNLDGFLRMLEASSGVRAQYNGGTVILTRRR